MDKELFKAIRKKGVSQYLRMKTIEWFINKGVDVNAKDNWDYTLLINASNDGHTEIVSMLLEKGADVNARDEQFGWTAFMWACQKRYTEIVSMLLDKGSDVNAKDNEDRTALMLASDYGDTEIVAMLLEKGADVNAKTKQDWTALMLAMNARDYDSETSRYFMMASHKHIELVTMLLEKGADVNAKNKEGHTALMCANGNEYTETAKLIENHIRRIELMKQILKTALIIKKGLTQKGDKLLMPSAQRETIHRIASFF